MRQFNKFKGTRGFILWLIGYALGMVLFMVVPPSMIGWAIMPIGIIITLYSLVGVKKC